MARQIIRMQVSRSQKMGALAFYMIRHRQPAPMAEPERLAVRGAVRQTRCRILSAMGAQLAPSA